MSSERKQPLENRLFLKDESATEAFGKTLAELSLGKGIITLSGDLGVGKTTLSRGLIRAFGHTGAVKSPTYTIVEPYDFSDKRIMHFDLYRLEDPEELEYLGFRDYLDDNTLCLIEWPEKAQGALPQVDLKLTLSYNPNEGRYIHWDSNSSHGHSIHQDLTKHYSLALSSADQQ